VAALAIPACARAAAELQRPPLGESSRVPIAIVPGGAVWLGEGPALGGGPLLFQPFVGNTTRVGWGPGYTDVALASSGAAVGGLDGEGRFVGGVAPGPLRPMYQPEAVPGPECEAGWAPDTGSNPDDVPPDFILARTKIVSAGVCLSDPYGNEIAGPQPLFIHDVRGGEWHVWRWLHGGFEPALAAEGGLVAIGDPLRTPEREAPVRTTPQAPVRDMRVTLVDLGRRGQQTHFIAPIGQLAFASRDRLVITAAERFRAGAAASSGTRPVEEALSVRYTYRAYLYSLRGRRLGDLGTFATMPHVSHMHLLVTREGTVANERMITVRHIPGGAPADVIGLQEPQREVAGLAFDWPALVLAETTAAPLDAEHVNCATGYYTKSNAPSLHVIDLAAPHRYEPAPRPSPLIAENVLATKECRQVVHPFG
jgi:hypothetical protein